MVSSRNGAFSVTYRALALLTMTPLSVWHPRSASSRAPRRLREGSDGAEEASASSPMSPLASRLCWHRLHVALFRQLCSCGGDR
jgi:hypothetical protein